MALLMAKPKSKKIPLSLRFSNALISEIKAYNEFVGIDRLDDFFEQAALYILEKDKDWQKKSDKIQGENE
jgi:hypothetical protein